MNLRVFLNYGSVSRKEWNKIPNELCLELINSMPRRIEAVLKARGGNTKY